MDPSKGLSHALDRTPRLVLSVGALENNIDRMATRVSAMNASLRPHAKTHKSPEIARRQVGAGACGVTVATAKEAVVFVEAGVTNVLMAFPPVSPSHLHAIRHLSDRATVIASCSEATHVEALAAAGREDGRSYLYYWEIDSGAGRLGTSPGVATAAILAPLAQLDGAHVVGLMTFPGHAYSARTSERLAGVAQDEERALHTTARALADAGIKIEVLSGGSTPISALEVRSPATEYRFGNYVFNDMTQVALGAASLGDCALRVATRIIGRPASDRFILDAGSKALSAEAMITPRGSRFGYVVDHPKLEIHTLYEEHAIVLGRENSPLDVGDIVYVIPNHACTCANLHASYLVVDNGEPIAEWELTARGW